MLFLQGENQKAVVFSELAKNSEYLIISNMYLSMDVDYFQYESIQSNKHELEKELFDSNSRWILLYTNSPKENLKSEIEWLQKLEKEGIITNSILACR